MQVKSEGKDNPKGPTMTHAQRQYDDESRATDEAFDPSEEGYCSICGQEADLDSGVCETCHGLRLDGLHDLEIAGGAYWFCVDYHGGQFSGLYEAQCRNAYKPGPWETGPEKGTGMEDAYQTFLHVAGLDSVNNDEGLSRHA